MSSTYTDLTETQFPDKVDDLQRMSDLSAADIPLVNQYYEYYNAGNMTAAAQLLASNPSLLSKLFNAAKFNVLHDALIALERYYMSDVQTYINTVRDALQDEVDQLTVYGEYNASTTYKKFNFVLYEGYVYVSQKDNLRGVAPTVGKSDDNWSLITMKGDKGESGTGLSWRGTYSNTTQYYKDDCVSDGQRIWVALKDSIGQTLIEGEYWSCAISIVGKIESADDHYKVGVSESYAPNVDNIYMGEVFGTISSFTFDPAGHINGYVIQRYRLPDVVDIMYGGTGAKNAADARTALGVTPENIGAASKEHSHEITDVTNLQKTLDDKASASHNQSASTITAGTFASENTKAKTGTDYGTYRIRNIAYGTAAMTAKSSPLSNGDIYLQYE